MPSHTRFPSPVSLVVFVTGLVAAVVSGVETYRAVGVYGGPIRTGFHREWDPQTSRYQLIHETTNKAGTRIRRLMTDDLQVQKTTLGVALGETTIGNGDVDGRIGFSTAKDGVVDAWATRDAKGETARIEVSTKRDGKIDRWEQYIKGQLVRVDLDTNGNGKADRWMTYEDGILTDTFVDTNEDGKPDGPPSG